MGTFRGDDPHSAEEFCEALSIYETLLAGDEDVLSGLESIFSRERITPRRRKDSEPASQDEQDSEKTA